MNKGIFSIASADYHAERGELFGSPCLSHSGIVTILQHSPRHAWQRHPKLNPTWKESERESAEQKRMDMGTAAHCLLLEPELFETKVIVVEATDWRTKDAQEQRRLANQLGLVAILQADAARLRPVAARATEALRLIGHGGRGEQSVLWTERGDIACKARPDWIGDGILVDYKLTTASAKPEAIERRIADMGYDIQAQWYTRAMRAVEGGKWQFYFLTQEWAPPYEWSLVALDPAFQAMGDDKCDRGLELWQKSMQSGTWPGYPEGLVYVSPPAYEMARWEEAVASGDGLSFEERSALGGQG